MKKIGYTFFTLVGIIGLGISPTIFAAELVYVPDIGTYQVGQTFSVSIQVSSPELAVNAFSGEVQYPSTLLKVEGVSKTNSIVNFWTTSPVASSSVVTFEGIALDPGYTGTHGQIAKITFRAIAPGVANIKFKSASVLANDGLGTSVISTPLRTASYTILKSEIPIVEEKISFDTPPKPVVSSSTHPDQSAWYANNAPLISWIIPESVSGAGLSVDQNANSLPFVHSLGRTTGYNIAKLSDGVWYAHVRFVNSTGWGGTTHYRFGIDTTPPSEFVITPTLNAENSTRAVLTFKATDTTSGIDSFVLSIDGAPSITVPAGDSWQTPDLAPGEHTVVGEAFDKARNSLKTTVTFTTNGILPPTIDTYPKELKSGESLILTGHTYPNAKVVMSIKENLDTAYSFGSTVYQKNGEPNIQKEITANNSGVFTFVYDKKVKSGTYTISAVAKVGSYESASSAPVVVLVMQSLFARIVQFLMHFFDLIIPLVGVIALFVGLLLYIRHKYRMYRNRIAEDISEMDTTIVSQINALKKAQSGADLKAHEIVFLEKLESEIRKVREDIRYTKK